MSCGKWAFVIGEKAPAMSVNLQPPEGPSDSGYIIYFSDFTLDDPEFEAWSESAGAPVCLHCLINDGDEQLAVGLDLAKQHGHVLWDPDEGEWFVPDDAPERV